MEPEFVLQVHWFGKQEKPTSFAIEFRPRVGSWSEFYVAIPLAHRDDVRPSTVRLAGFGNAPLPDPKCIGDDGWLSADGEWWISAANGVVDGTTSAFYYCQRLPRAVVFGPIGGVQHRALLSAEVGQPVPTLPRLPSVLRIRGN